MPQSVIDAGKAKMEKAIETLETRLVTIRAGRANPSMLNGIMVECYGCANPLNTLANISVVDARQLFIKPFDKSILKEIEKAIFEANLGLTPTNNGEVVILTVPELTEDKRRDYVKQAKMIGEEAKIALRNIRQDANNLIKKLELPEDQEKANLDDVQELITKYNAKVDQVMKDKENELMEI